MKLTEVLQEPRESFEGEVLSDKELTTFCLLGAFRSDATYAAKPGPLRVLDDQFNLIFPRRLADLVFECSVQYGWADERDHTGYVTAREEMEVVDQADTAITLIRSPCELWMERGPGADRWMTIERATFNQTAALELLHVASTTAFFDLDDSQELRRYWRWITPTKGFQLAILRQWECAQER